MARDARIEMLARYYNMKTQSDEQLVNSRVKAISEALERADNDMEFIKAHVDEYAQLFAEDKRTMTKCFASCPAKVQPQRKHNAHCQG